MENLKKYENNCSEAGLLQTIKKNIKKIGLPLVYKALQMYYVLQNPSVPLKAKTIIVGSLGYLISPVDAVPDFLPGGFVDDALVISSAFGTALAYIGTEEEEKAKRAIDWAFGKGTSKALEAA